MVQASFQERMNIYEKFRWTKILENLMNCGLAVV